MLDILPILTALYTLLIILRKFPGGRGYETNGWYALTLKSSSHVKIPRQAVAGLRDKWLIFSHTNSSLNLHWTWRFREISLAVGGLRKKKVDICSCELLILHLHWIFREKSQAVGVTKRISRVETNTWAIKLQPNSLPGTYLFQLVRHTKPSEPDWWTTHFFERGAADAVTENKGRLRHRIFLQPDPKPSPNPDRLRNFSELNEEFVWANINIVFRKPPTAREISRK